MSLFGQVWLSFFSSLTLLAQWLRDGFLITKQNRKNKWSIRCEFKTDPYPDTMWIPLILGIVGMSMIAAGSQEPTDLQTQLFGGLFILIAFAVAKTQSDRKDK